MFIFEMGGVRVVSFSKVQAAEANKIFSGRSRQQLTRRSNYSENIGNGLVEKI
jgi:hypothetical protein